VLVAHLFGGLGELCPLVEIAHRHGLVMIEDCAQAYQGREFTGSAEADVSMFSFGVLKTRTALGGAVLLVRDVELRRRMRARLEAWPSSSRLEFGLKIARVAAIKALSTPIAYGLLARGCARAGADFDRIVNRAVRGFPARTELAFTSLLERKAATPCLLLLGCRLRSRRDRHLEDRAATGEWMSERIPAQLLHPGDLMTKRTHWLFPVLTEHPCNMTSALREAGFDASQGASSVIVVTPPRGRPELNPQEARWMMNHLVFIPAYPELPLRQRERIVRVLATLAEAPS
jgi:dTDP-4-amino-4,6-dideoxygalactose transaminase